MKKTFGILLIVIVGLLIWMLASRQAAAPADVPSNMQATSDVSPSASDATPVTLTETTPQGSGTAAPAPVPSQTSSGSGTAKPASVAPVATTPAVPVTAAVSIKGYAFGPTLTVKKGTKVTWTNQDTAKHTVSFDTMAVESPFFGAGESYSYTFDKAGTFPYHCSPHPYMKGSVVVTE